ncbi:MAG: sulfotransferase, partial [Actinobacteria bacterium]|nr:sulfotransferase [Actinomycetota bacterium]
DLACPPETNVPALCGQLATVWSLIEGAPLSANRGDEPPDIPDAAIAGVRETMDRMTGSYLARRGKKRYCDKSLGTARFSYLMQRIWPRTKFICLFRHPMDVIASGMEACPWGLNGYGFDPYIAETPGNSVHALAHFWVDNAATILTAEQQFAERCHRVRYEDMVADPQAVADRLFKFLDVDLVPGIAEACFAAERERFGPADYKIWHTSQITDDSVGRGWTIPAGLIGPQIRAGINELCGKLGYLPVDENWGTADRPADLRLPAEQAETEPAEATDEGAAPPADTPVLAPANGDTPEPGFAAVVGERLEAGLSRLGKGFSRRWKPCASELFEVVATPAGPGPNARWRVNLAARSLSAVNCSPGTGDDGGQADSAWDIIASADTWKQLIDGRVNMSVALRRHDLRYCDTGEAGPVVADTRIAMLADLLGLTSWGQARQAMTAPRQAKKAASAAAPS